MIQMPRRAAIQPVSAPPTISSGNRAKRLAQVGIGRAQHDVAHEQAEQRDGCGIVQQALALDDPRQPPRRRDRAEIDTTAEGSVVDTNGADQQAGGQRQRAGKGQRVADPSVATTTATRPSTRIGHPVISASAARFIPSVAWTAASAGRHRGTRSTGSEPRIASAAGFNTSVSSVRRKKIAPSPISTPRNARITLLGSPRRAGGPEALRADHEEQRRDNGCDDDDVHRPQI